MSYLLISRVWINAGGVIENIPLNMTENNRNDSSATINKRGDLEKYFRAVDLD